MKNCQFENIHLTRHQQLEDHTEKNTFEVRKFMDHSLSFKCFLQYLLAASYLWISPKDYYEGQITPYKGEEIWVDVITTKWAQILIKQLDTLAFPLKRGGSWGPPVSWKPSEHTDPLDRCLPSTHCFGRYDRKRKVRTACGEIRTGSPSAHLVAEPDTRISPCQVSFLATTAGSSKL